MMINPLPRRTFLRAGAACVALPMLDAMGAKGETAPKRMVLVHRPLGTYHPHLVPEQTGLNYQAPRYLQKLEEHRGKFTLLSGVSHRGYPNSHHTDNAIFTGVDPAGVARGDDIHNSISLDQELAEHIGGETRVRSLTLNSANCASLSWNRKGVPVPMNRRRSQLFRQLFIDGTPEEIEAELRRLEHGKSILDDMRDQLKSLTKKLGAADRERIEIMETSIREAEQQLHQEEAWITKPKPVVEATEKDFADQTNTWLESQQRWYALIHLALQTDSTRVIVYGLGEHNNNNIADLEIGHHDASHHGKNPEKIEQFARYEEKEYANFAGFLKMLGETREPGGNLLDNTQVLLTSNLGDASAHASNNLPTFLAGGGFKHQGHLAFDPKNNYPLSNLFVRMLQRFDLETDRFGNSTSVLSELG
tara:strand:- start:9163 stop:10419 length:1257 start_codon:yes stop_codon:yes gene_type:complete